MIDDPGFQALLVVHIGQQQQLVGGWLGRMSSLTYLLVKDLRRLFLVKQLVHGRTLDQSCLRKHKNKLASYFQFT